LALANGSGPFIGGAVVEKSTWRWVFWMVPMVAIPAGVAIQFCLPLQHNSGNYVEKVKKIDYGGILLNLAAVLLVLVSQFELNTTQALMLIRVDPTIRRRNSLRLVIGIFHRMFNYRACIGCSFRFV
jgi:predicted MFS family arabinose efflux permease